MPGLFRCWLGLNHSPTASVTVPNLPRWITISTGVFLAALSFAQGWAGVFRDRDPTLALELAPWDSRAKAVSASLSLLRSTDSKTLTEADRLARSSLKREPIQPVGLRVVGSVADGQGRAALTLRLMTASQMLSRRDVLTQLWWIEHYSRTDDVARALSHYDVALSSSEESWQILFPVLVGVSDDPEFAQSLRGFFGHHRDRPWRAQLLATTIGSVPDPKSLMRWLPAILDPSNVGDKELLRNLIRRLVNAQQFDPAFDVYRQVIGQRGLSPERLRNANVSAATYPPFDWDLANEADRAAEIVSAAGNTIMSISASDGRGPLAGQLVKLSAGRYRFGLVTIGETQGDGLSIDVSCAISVVASQQPPRAYPLDTSSGRSEALIETVPGCDWHRLVLSYNGGRSGVPFAANIAQVSLQRQ
jgi:hypothetical protein